MPNPNREYEEARRLLVRAVACIKGNEPDNARRHLEHALRLPATTQQKADAHFLLSLVSEEETEQREYLASSLGYDPGHYRARKALAILDGKLKDSEIINPDTFRPKTSQVPLQRDGHRFECPNCGGRLTYSPDGASLVCEQCDQDKASLRDGDLSEHDAIIGLAKAQGHQHATATQSFECKACGAVFLLAPEILALTCPHCSSAYSIIQSETRELIPPEGIIPFQLDEHAAEKAVKTWVEKNARGESPPIIELTGIYLPAWTFDFNGEVRWTGYIQQDENTTIPVRDARFVRLDDVFVPGSRQVPDYFEELLLKFSAADVKPFSPDYTASWLAETYQIPLADAAVEARAVAFKLAKQIARRKDHLNKVRNLNFTSEGIVLQTYKLVLVPVWMGHYRLEQESYPCLVNGKTGLVMASKPPGVFKKFVNWLLEE